MNNYYNVTTCHNCMTLGTDSSKGTNSKENHTTSNNIKKHRQQILSNKLRHIQRYSKLYKTP